MLVARNSYRRIKNKKSSSSQTNEQRGGVNEDLREKFRNRVQGNDTETEMEDLEEENFSQSNFGNSNVIYNGGRNNDYGDNSDSDAKTQKEKNEALKELRNLGKNSEKNDGDGTNNSSDNEEKKDDSAEDKEENEEDFEGKDSVLDTIKFRVNAFKMLAFQQTDMKCPYCEKKSIYMEQIHEKLFRDIVWAWCGLTREPRYICVNKKCRAYFNKHKSRMKVGYSGRLQYTHFLGSFIDFNIFHIDR